MSNKKCNLYFLKIFWKLLKKLIISKTVKENRNVLSLTETELIDMIESLVLEQKVKDTSEKNNISKKMEVK